ncbi:hypothetical protein TNCT_686371 [Trichonephila clavata]|uniref:Uncharacterized protein n=1 Tax=Trichonephila clavata TaxID=2740835 RepID=A0A8X6HBR7_TRICU|nr:hypothetical protein TNCT_686371 [Trichonephila clavata]
MSVQRFLRLEEALELLNSSDSDESDIEIAVLPPDVNEITDENKGDQNEINTSEILVNDIPGSLEVRTGDNFQPELSTSSSVLTMKSR